METGFGKEEREKDVHGHDGTHGQDHLSSGFTDNEHRYKRLKQEMADRNVELKTSEQLYHKMIEEVEDYAILMLDRDGIIRNWNKGAQKIKGYKEEEIVGNHFRIFYPLEDQQRQLPEKLIEEAINAGKAIHEGWRVRKDGTKFWGSIVITALHDDANGIIGFSKVTRDLTERKNAEEKIWQYTKQLESQNKELQQFAFAAAHDMKEPLRKIQLYNSAILEDEGIQLKDKQKDYLLRSADAAKRMQGLIDDLLSFTKITEQRERFEEVDLNGTFQEVYAFYKETLEQLNATIVSGPLPVVNGIPFQLRQLLLNLIGNSLKYHFKERAPRVSISAGSVLNPLKSDAGNPAHGTFYKITIEDNGIGFKQEYGDKIFQMFERLHSREEFPGSGIGLAICKKIAENHSGFITAEGYPDRGARFDIYLPA